MPSSRATIALHGPGRAAALGALALLVLALLALALEGGASSRPSAAQTSAQPLDQGAYLWQRRWHGAVRAAVDDETPQLDSLLVLAAEIDEGEVHRVAWDPEALVNVDVESLGLVIRVGPWSGPFAEAGDPILAPLLATITAERERAEAAGLSLAEIQIDFDAASARLGDYRRWLIPAREAAGEVPLTITALPDWLKQAELPELLAACDGWVLQVHGLTPPQRGGEREILDPAAARRWVEQADAIASRLDPPRSFRVALPTYTYLVARRPEPDGLRPIAAEGFVGEADRLRFARAGADPRAVAELVSSWQRERPETMTGLLWFRLPVAGDRLAWTAPTFAAVRSGRAPRERRELELCTPADEPEILELRLHNRGEGEGWIDAPVELRWPKRAEFLAADGLDGFAAESVPGALRLRPRRHARVDPGEHRTLGWLRFASPEAVEIVSELPLERGSTCR